MHSLVYPYATRGAVLVAVLIILVFCLFGVTTLTPALVKQRLSEIRENEYARARLQVADALQSQKAATDALLRQPDMTFTMLNNILPDQLVSLEHAPLHKVTALSAQTSHDALHVRMSASQYLLLSPLIRHVPTAPVLFASSVPLHNTATISAQTMSGHPVTATGLENPLESVFELPGEDALAFLRALATPTACHELGNNASRILLLSSDCISPARLTIGSQGHPVILISDNIDFTLSARSVIYGLLISTASDSVTDKHLIMREGSKVSGAVIVTHRMSAMSNVVAVHDTTLLEVLQTSPALYTTRLVSGSWYDKES